MKFEAAITLCIAFAIAAGVFALIAQHYTRTPPRHATRISMWKRFVRWVSKRREQRDLGWRSGWDHLSG